MPEIVQGISNFFAIRHWLTILRGVMLKGVGLDVLWPQVLAIVIIGTVILAVTVTMYRRNVE